MIGNKNMSSHIKFNLVDFVTKSFNSFGDAQLVAQRKRVEHGGIRCGSRAEPAALIANQFLRDLGYAANLTDLRSLLP